MPFRAAALRFGWPDDIEQQRRNAGVGEMRGDARTHGAGAEDGNTMNGSHRLLQIHRAHVLLSIARSSCATFGEHAIDLLEFRRS